MTLKPRKRQPHICARCASSEIQVRHKSEVMDFKGLTLEVDGIAETVCNACGLRWFTDGQEQDNLALLKAVFAKKRDLLRDKEGLLTGEEIAHALDQLQLTKADAAKLFGGGPNAFGKYISGDVLQSFAMDRLIRLSLAFGSTAVDYLRHGKDAPLKLNSGGIFICAALSSGTVTKVTQINSDQKVTPTQATSQTVALQG
jgi:HTH-type transcriptional regulator / antitoxin MqsA